MVYKMIIYRLNPDPVEIGSYEKGIVSIGNVKKEMSEKEVLDRFNKGYYRISI